MSWIDFHYRPFELPKSIDPTKPPDSFVMWAMHSLWERVFRDRPEQYFGLVIRDYIHWLRHLESKGSFGASQVLKEVHELLVSGCATPKSKLASKHVLVGWLYRYIEYYRSKAALDPKEYQLRKEQRLLDWMVERLISLPDLSPDSVDEWAKAGKKLIGMATNSRPLEHPAFCKGGIFADLGSHDARGEARLWTRLREGWKALAKTSKSQKRHFMSAENPV